MKNINSFFITIQNIKLFYNSINFCNYKVNDYNIFLFIIKTYKNKIELELT